MNCRLTIDGHDVEVEAGSTLLAAARTMGLDIPTLCHLETCGPSTSCLVCLVKVKVNGQAKFVPSCATMVQPALVVESETPDVHQARRTALELLLSDHVGDCLSPCHRICPLQLNVPLMIRQIEAGSLKAASATVRGALPLASIVARLCQHPCENGCRRGTRDQPTAIRDLERHAADYGLHSTEPGLPRCEPPSGKSVAIVGSGPAGLAAAYFLTRRGHACTIIDRHQAFGGALRVDADKKSFPREVLEAELDRLTRMEVQFQGCLELGREITLEGLQRCFTAILIATGEIVTEEVKRFGPATTTTGIKADPETFQTSQRNVFAAGSVVRPVKQLVRALSEGKAAAECIDQALRGETIRRRERPFSSIMGRLEEGEITAFMNGPNPAARVVPTDSVGGFNEAEARAEAARCVHCDCRAAGNCQLQRYAEIYGADPGHFRQQRRRFEQHRHSGGIIFEPGKCILCGICVQLTEHAREPLGLAFTGRGFKVRVSTPFHGSIAEGLRKAARDCVESCPTGALVFGEKQSAWPGNEVTVTGETVFRPVSSKEI